MAERKAFNFYKSYFDVYNELSNNDKIKFIDALLQRQFLGIEPTDLKGLVKFAYLSQKHSIDKQVKGFEDYYKTTITPPMTPPITPPMTPPMIQEKEQEKEKEEYTIPEISVFMIYIKDYLKSDSDRYAKIRQHMIDTYNAWKLNGWKDGNDKKIKNWKVKAINQLRYIK